MCFRSKVYESTEGLEGCKIVDCRKKRKGEYTYQEFKRDCKRLRPEFGNEECEEFDYNPSQNACLRQVHQPQIIFFSVFSKENAKKNHEIMFRKKYFRKPKLSSAKRVATSAQGIKKYFEAIKIESNCSNQDQSGGGRKFQILV